MYTRLNAYHILQLIVMFDLPVVTKRQRKAATDFRKRLEQDGYTRLQFSVYIRLCPSLEAQQMHIRRLRSFVPEEGSIKSFTITDKQYSNMITIYGAIEKKNKPVQLELEFF